jgi:phospholipase/carboxylesterase
MNDLWPLWEMWHQKDFNWYFPNGVMPLPMGYYEGRSWFSIDMEKLERAMRDGTPRDLAGSLPPELDSTLGLLEGFLTELSKRHKKIILGGFSQGAMCTSHLAMRPGLSLEGLVFLSGALLADERFPKSVRGLPFYQSHGDQDPVLLKQNGQELYNKLNSLGFKGEMHSFRGGHEIPSSVINGVRSFLAQF